jgi:hypothetical protein
MTFHVGATFGTLPERTAAEVAVPSFSASLQWHGQGVSGSGSEGVQQLFSVAVAGSGKNHEMLFSQ